MKPSEKLPRRHESRSAPKIADTWRVTRVSHTVAKPWIETWHYSGRMPTGKNYIFGLFDGDDLYAVAVYGTGVNPYQAKFLGVSCVVELKRLARSSPVKNYPMSKFVSETIKILHKEVGFECVVSFSDPEEGHIGTLYRACNFTHAGQTNAEWHVMDTDGNKRHRKFAYRYAKRNNVSIQQAREYLGLSRVKTLPKTRWVRYFNKTKAKPQI